MKSGNAAKGTSVVFNSVYGKADDRASSAGSGKYAGILKASDYTELSKSGESKRKLFGDARYDYINNIGNFRAQSDVQQAQGRGQDYGKYAFMTDDEIGVYNYLYATKGKKAANAYLSDLEPELDKQWYTGTNRATTEALGKNAATRTLASAMTVAAQPTRDDHKHDRHGGRCGAHGEGAGDQPLFQVAAGEQHHAGAPRRHLAAHRGNESGDGRQGRELRI